jgi:seryl-tRNA synthetase
MQPTTRNKPRHKEKKTMNANEIIQETMTLQEKLDAIDAAMRAVQEQAQEEARRMGNIIAPLDPADLTMCDGCQ